MNPNMILLTTWFTEMARVARQRWPGLTTDEFLGIASNVVNDQNPAVELSLGELRPLLIAELSRRLGPPVAETAPHGAEAERNYPERVTVTLGDLHGYVEAFATSNHFDPETAVYALVELGLLRAGVIKVAGRGAPIEGAE